MFNVKLLGLFVFFLTSSFSKDLNTDEKNLKKNKNITIILDFDDTITRNSSEEDIYSYALYKHAFEREDKYLLISLKYFLLKEYFKIKEETVSEYHNILKKLHQEYEVDINQEDINFASEKLFTTQTPGLKEVIKDLKKRNIQIIAIGGGSWGCGVIVPFLEKEFNLKKDEIYSGYFKDLSEKEKKRIITEDFKYYNCAYLDKLDTPKSDKKSDLVKFLKKKKLIHNEVLAIGDDVNDLEIYESDEASFIGFGVNKVVKEVKNKVYEYKKDLKDIEEKIDKEIKESKSTIKKRKIAFVLSIEELKNKIEKFIDKI